MTHNQQYQLKIKAWQQYRTWNNDFNCMALIYSEDNPLNSEFGFCNMTKHCDIYKIKTHNKEIAINPEMYDSIYILFDSKFNFELFEANLSREGKISDGFDYDTTINEALIENLTK